MELFLTSVLLECAKLCGAVQMSLSKEIKRQDEMLSVRPSFIFDQTKDG